jgi:hypothetical protein
MQDKGIRTQTACMHVEIYKLRALLSACHEQAAAAVGSVPL